MAKIRCTFTSEWDDGAAVSTPCIYHAKTGEVEPEVSLGTIPQGQVIREFITLPGGDELEICPDCHGYVLKPVVGDRADCSYGEYKECSDPDCEEIHD
jgi:hypothetical protein